MKSFVLNRIRRLLCPNCWGSYSKDQRRAMWPAVKPLEDQHIRNCRLLENRITMLDFLPKHGICAELGIFMCDFSCLILQKTRPKELHLIDIDPKAISIAQERFPQEIMAGVIKAHLGDSAQITLKMPDSYFDWVYIDADHHYAAVKKDLEAVRKKIKPDGLIVLNDYTFFGPSDCAKYGVIEAVHEFMIAYDFELIYLALQGRCYYDVAVRKLS